MLCFSQRAVGWGGVNTLKSNKILDIKQNLCKISQLLSKEVKVMRKFMFLLSIIIGVGVAQEVGARYLIITHDNFYNAIQPLAQWKHKSGLRTKVVKLSQIGSSSSQIKGYIQNAYNTWQTRPEFLLLVGAPNYLPWGASYGDNYYTNMDGDIYNEILSGRLTVHDATEAQTVVNKILLYEKTPNVNDSLWFTRACLVVREDYNYFDDSIYWSDINYTKNLMRVDGYGFIDTLSRSAGYNANDIISSVNTGRAFVLYRGSATNNWYNPFAVNPGLLQNGSKLPIVLSITCGTIGTGSTPATAERWLLTGTPTTPRGAAGYFATTTSGINISHLRSAVCKGFFNGLLQQGKRTFGEACEAGRLNVYNLYSSTSEYRGFTTLGDPAMDIWTAIPRPMEVFHDTSLPVGADTLTVRVEYRTVPVESALVCVMFDTTIYESGYTSSDGQIVFNFEASEPGYVHVTVTAHNKIPYSDSIPVVSTHIEEATELATAEHFNLSVSPNPFSKLTKVSFSIGQSAERIELKIYDAAGRRVKDLYHGSCIMNRESACAWDGTDHAGNKLPAGVYFVQVVTSKEKQTVPVLLVR